MATSASTNYSTSRDTIITEALNLLGVLGEGESPNASQLTDASRTLNMMVKAWQAEGLNLFAVRKLYLLLEKNKNEYSLPGDNVTATLVTTTTSAAASSGASTISVTSITGISSADKIGIELADGTSQWTTVNGAPSGTTVTLTAALTGAVDSGAVVHVYTTAAGRPMKILSAYRHNYSSGSDTPVHVLSRDEYYRLSNKTVDGAIVQVYYNPLVGTGKLFVWPETDSVEDYLILLVQRTLEDFDAAGDEPDFPQEWYLSLCWNLAALLSPKFGVGRSDRTDIVNYANYLKDQAWGFDSEELTSVQFEIDRRA